MYPDNLEIVNSYSFVAKIFLGKINKKYDVQSIRKRVLESQSNRALVFRSLQKGATPVWDFEPQSGRVERDRYTRNTAILLNQDRKARIPQQEAQKSVRKPKFEMRNIGKYLYNQEKEEL